MKTMKLGTQTGSLFNHIYSMNQNQPIVGKGATILQWTDRHAYEVLEVTEKTIKLQRYKSKTDASGYQKEYDELEGKAFELVMYRGNWCQIHENIIWEKGLINSDFSNLGEMREKYITAGGTYSDVNCMKNVVISGLTKIKKTYCKINIVFGMKKEYYDPHF